MNRIWKRHFIFELLKVFSLFIGCFYFLYVLIDYSAHTKVFQGDQITFLEVMLYYIWQFTKRADILVPIALAISSIKVLTTANIRHELIILTTGGISLKGIMRPFLSAAFFFACLLYLNFQFIQPYSIGKINQFEHSYFKEHSDKEPESHQVKALVLEDDTLLVYQFYQPENNSFFDVFWLKSADLIYRMQALFPYEKIPRGTHVDILKRLPNGEFVKTASLESTSFPQMRFEQQALFNAATPPQMQSLSQLAQGMGGGRTLYGLRKMSDREAEASSFFYFKLTIPLACLLAIIGPAPFCLRFTRSLPTFLIYALSLFGIIAFFTLINSSVILGKSQVLPPALAILIPQTLSFLILGWKYAKL